MATKSKTIARLEDIYEDAGGMGAYQWCAFVLLGMFALFAVESVNINFVAGSQDHWCRISELSNLSHALQKYIAVPEEAEGQYESCKKFKADYSAYTMDDFIAWNRTAMSGNLTTIECSEWVYDESLYVNTLTSRFDLVCDDGWLISMISTVFMAGVLLGALGSGILSDRYGRKPIIYGGLILKIASSFLATFPVHYAVTLLARFFLGIGSTSCYLTSFVLLMELLNGTWRRYLGIFFNIFFSLGFMMWPLIALFIRDDMKLQLTGTIPLVFLLPFWWLLDESPEWLLQQERYDDVNRVMRRIGNINNSPLSDDFDARNIKVAKKTTGNRGCMSLMRSPTMRMRTIVIDLYWFTVSLMYYALSLNTGTLFGDVFVNTIVSGAIEIPFSVAGAFMIGWKMFGRKRTCVISLVFAGVASFITVYMILEDVGIAHTVFTTVAKGCVTLSFNAIYVYSSELFPTDVRNVGIGTASMCARISGMVAPYVGGPLGDVWAPLPPVVYGSLAVVSGFLTLLLPETLGAPLFKTLEEAEAYGKDPKPLPISEIKVQTEESVDKQHFEHESYQMGHVNLAFKTKF